MNCNKTEYMLVKDCEHEEVKSLNGSILNQVNDFKYLGSYISSSKKDFEIRKAQACVALKFQPKQKINLFKTYIESIVLYGSETWTLSKQLEKCLDGTCTSNESTKHQLETTFYTGTDLWKPPKGFRCR